MSRFKHEARSKKRAETSIMWVSHFALAKATNSKDNACLQKQKTENTELVWVSHMVAEKV